MWSQCGWGYTEGGGGQWPTDCYWPSQRTAPPPEVEIKTNITVNTSAAASWNWTQRSTSLYKHQDFHTVRNKQPCSHTMGHLKTPFFFLLIHNQAVHVQIFFGKLISNSKSNFWFPLFNFCNYIVNDFSIWFNEKDLKT